MTEDSKFESFYQKLLFENKDILKKYKKEATEQRIKAVIIPRTIIMGIYIAIFTYSIIAIIERWGVEGLLEMVFSPIIILVIILSVLYYYMFGWFFYITKGLLTVKENVYNNIFKKNIISLLFELFEQKVWYEPNG